MPITVKSQSPLRGINRALSREAQPEGTIYDALNVLPFERYGRLRAGQRSGTSKLWAAALGLPSAVNSLTQTTLALDPSSISANVLLATEPFTAAGPTNLPTYSANWVVYTGAPPATDATRLVVQTNKCRSGLVYANPGYGLYQPAETIGTVYLLRATITPGAIGANQRFRLFTRMNKGAPTSTAVNLCLSLDNVTSTTSDPTCKLYLCTDITAAAGTGTPTNSFTFPANAFNSATSYTLEMQVNGDTIRGLINGVAYVTITTTTNNTQVGIGFNIQAGFSDATMDDWSVYTGQNLSSYRQTNIIAVSNGNIYMGDIATQATVATGGTGALSPTYIPGVAFTLGKGYFVTGFDSLKQLDLATRNVTTWVGTAGAETAASLGQYQLACVYRGRLVLAADRVNPQNFTMSRVGVPTDFDYSQTDPATAFAGNASQAGRIGEPITALIPFSDDLLLIGGDHNLWAIRGDPADGGSIDLVSDAIGVLGANAWCKSPDGTVYFVGTGGLFRMGPQEQHPTNISLGAYPQFFQQINRGTNYILMAWDRDRQGAYIFVTPVNTGTTVHLWYDLRTDSYWPLQYPTSFGPLSTLVYDGDGPTDRTLLLGGRTGLVQETSTTARNDDGTAISANLVFGPIQPVDGQAATLVGTTIDFGELSSADASSPSRWQATVNVRSGKTAYDVTEGTPTGTAQVSWGRDRRTKTLRQRLRGEWFALKISDGALNNYFAFETLWMEFEPAGKNRRQR